MGFKRHRSILVPLLFALAAAGPACAQDVLKRIAGRGKIVVGYGPTSAPFSFVQGGKPAGYAIALCDDVVEQVRRDLGRPDLPVEFFPVEQDEVSRLVGSSTVDLMCAGVSDTPQRRRTMAFSAPIFISSVKLLVRGADGPHATSALKGGTVAVLGRTTAEAAVQDLSKRQALDLKVARVVSSDAAMSQLRLKQADAWARDEVLLLAALARQPDAGQYRMLDEELSSEPIAIAMGHDPQLQRTVDSVLAANVRTGRMQRLYDQWFTHPAAAATHGIGVPMSPALKDAFDRLR